MNSRSLAGFALAMLVSTFGASVCVATDKDERDTVLEARVFHILLLQQGAAEELYGQLQAVAEAQRFESFKRLAKERSIDKGSADTGGDLGYFLEGTMVRAFEAASFTQDIGVLSRPFRTEFGWHLILVTDRRTVSVGKICDAALEKAISSASGAERQALEAGRNLKDRTEVSALLGEGWGPPLMDHDRNLAYMSQPKDTAQYGIKEIIFHTEMAYAKLDAAKWPPACSRSQQSAYLIDCPRRALASSEHREFEGRGATGKVLRYSRTPPAELTYRPILPKTVGSDLYMRACGNVIHG